MNVRHVLLPWEGAANPYVIIPVEAHYSRRTRSNGFCRDTWKRFLKRVESDPMARVIFVGDLRDADRPSTRERRLLMGVGRPEVLDEDDLQDMEDLDAHLIKDLLPIKDKILAMVDGDHYRVYCNGTTSTKYLCGKLGIPKAYLGERMGWVRIRFYRGPGIEDAQARAKKSGRSFNGLTNCFNFDIFVRHGKGSATTFGTDVNALVRQSIGFDAELYVGGHTHRQWFVKVPYLFCGHHDIRQRFVGYARAGSFLRGFLYGQATYAETCEYNPLSIGWPEIQIHLDREGSDRRGMLYVRDLKGLT